MSVHYCSLVRSILLIAIWKCFPDCATNQPQVKTIQSIKLEGLNKITVIPGVSNIDQHTDDSAGIVSEALEADLLQEEKINWMKDHLRN